MPQKMGLEEAWRMAIQNEQDAHDLYQEMAEQLAFNPRAELGV